MSRVTSLDSPAIITQAGALISVEMQDGSILPVSELGNGQYAISQIPVNPSEQYRLRIATPDGKAYSSDFSSPIVTPPIDSVSWKLTPEGVNIYMSAPMISPTIPAITGGNTRKHGNTHPDILQAMNMWAAGQSSAGRIAT